MKSDGVKQQLLTLPRRELTVLLWESGCQPTDDQDLSPGQQQCQEHQVLLTGLTTVAV